MAHLRVTPAFIVFFVSSSFSLFLFSFFVQFFHGKHQYPRLTFDVSSVVGAPWRRGVLTTQGGIAGFGVGHPPERLAWSSRRKRIVAKENGASPDWIIIVVGCWLLF